MNTKKYMKMMMMMKYVSIKCVLIKMKEKEVYYNDVIYSMKEMESYLDLLEYCLNGHLSINEDKDLIVIGD